MTKRKFMDLSKCALGDQSEFLAEALFRKVYRLWEYYLSQLLLYNQFRVFDDDNSGTMDFTEYMMAINATSLNTPEDKLNWMFDVFDKDGGGTISSDEIKDLLMLETCYLSDNDILLFHVVDFLRWLARKLKKKILRLQVKISWQQLMKMVMVMLPRYKGFTSFNIFFLCYHKILFSGWICEACTQKEISINTYPRAKVCSTTCWITKIDFE